MSRIDFNSVLDKLDKIEDTLDKQIININTKIPADSMMDLVNQVPRISKYIEGCGLNIIDLVLSFRDQSSSISFTCEVHNKLPISKDIRVGLQSDVFKDLGIKLNILK